MVAAMIYSNYEPPRFHYAMGGSTDFPSVVEPTHMAGGGVAGMVSELAENAPKLAKFAAQKLRDANLAKFLEQSADPGLFFHGNSGRPPKSYRNGDMSYTQALNKFTDHGISKFNPDEGVNGREMTFLSPSPEFASEYAMSGLHYAPAMYPLHVQVKNPFDYENPAHVEAMLSKLGEMGKLPGGQDAINARRYELTQGDWPAIEHPDVIRAAKDLGHDAMYMSEGNVKNLGVFDPRRIKSAIGNQGTYDITNPDISKSTGGEIRNQRMAGGGLAAADGGMISKAAPHFGHVFALDPLYETAKAVAAQKWGHALQGLGDLAQVYTPMKLSVPAQLATYTEDLNTNEPEELAKRQAMGYLPTK
jgi:hypothetical protein